MSQSDAEANRLMEQQRLGGEDTFSSRLADEEDEDDEINYEWDDVDHNDKEDDDEALEDCPICTNSETIDGSGRCRECGWRKL